MRTAILLLCAASAFGQSFNNIKIMPAGGAASSISLYDDAGTNFIGLVSPATLAGNSLLVLPVPTGSTGCVSDSTGTGVLVIGACGAGGSVTNVTGLAPIVSSGGTTPQISCPTCATTAGSVTSFNTRVGAVTLLKADVTAVDQDLGTGDAPTFAGITATASTGGNIATVTQSGAGNALVVTGPASVTLNSGSAGLLITQTGAGDALDVHGALGVVGASNFSGLVSIQGATGAANIQQASQTWYLTGTGIGYFHDVVSRNVFNSIGDVPQVGVVNSTGGSITIPGYPAGFEIDWVSGDLFDVSMVGGQLLICAGGCTGLNGSLFTINGWGSFTQVTVATNPGALAGAGYSYQGNAFQTSTGRTYTTGTGIIGAQRIFANGITSNGVGSLSGNCNTSGTSVIRTSGDAWDPSLVGGKITINSVVYVVASFQTDHQMTLSTSAGTQTGVAWSFTVNAFQEANGKYTVDPSGNTAIGGTFDVTSGVLRVTSTGGSTMSATGQSGGVGALFLHGNNSTNCWDTTANGSGSSLVLGYTNSCAGAYSPTTEVTFTPGGVTFAQGITVPSCSGCTTGVTSVGATAPIVSSGGTTPTISCPTCATTGSGVSSFNTRTGAVTLTDTDVSAAGGRNSFTVNGTGGASLVTVAGTFAGAFIGLHGNNSTNCWDTTAATGSSMILGYTSSCGGGYSVTTEVTYTPSGVTFAQPITVPSCTGCTGAVSSVSGSGAGISVSPTTGAVIISNLGVTSATAGSGVTVSASTGAVTFSIGQAVGTGNTPQFSGVQAGSYKNSAGSFTWIDASGNIFGNSVKISGLTTGSGGSLLCGGTTVPIYVASGGVC